MKKNRIILIISLIFTIYFIDYLNNNNNIIYNTEYKASNNINNSILDNAYINPEWEKWNALSDDEKSKLPIIPRKYIVDFKYENSNNYDAFLYKYNIFSSQTSKYDTKYNL